MKALVTGGRGSSIASLRRTAAALQQVFVLTTSARAASRTSNTSTAACHCVIDLTLNQEIVRDPSATSTSTTSPPRSVSSLSDEPIRTITNNIRGTETVLEEACRYRRRVLVASTSEVYGKSDKEVFREDDDRIMGSTHLSRWSYAESKAIDEFLTLAYWRSKRMPCVVVRLFNTVGPRQTGRYGMVIPRFVSAALRGEPIPVFGDGKQTRCFAYVGDVVPALFGLMDNRTINGEIFNIGSTQRITIEDLAKRVIALTGSKSELQCIPYDQAYGPGYEDMRHRAPSLEKIRTAIAFEPKTSLDQILQSVIDEMKRNPGREF